MTLKVQTGGKTYDLPLEAIVALPELMERVEALAQRVADLERQLRETKDED